MSRGSPAVPGQLVVVCDVGPTYGVGHLMRCVALAEEFAERGHRVTFVADVAAVPFAARQLERRGFAAVAPPPSADAYADVVDGLVPDTVVVDSYHLPASVYAELRGRHRTLALVDGDPGGRTADVLLDQNLGAEHDDWPLPEGVTRLAGLRYALMRSEILEERPARPRTDESSPLQVFAFFGGTDAFGAGPVLTRALVATGARFDLTVVAPQAWPEPVEPGPGQTVRLLEPTDDLAARVTAADVVVSAAGTSSWELLCLRAACGFVCVADNQRVGYDRAVGTGAVVGLGVLPELREDPAPAVQALGRLLGDAALRRRLREDAGDVVDGLGRRRVADAVLAVPARR